MLNIQYLWTSKFHGSNLAQSKKMVSHTGSCRGSGLHNVVWGVGGSLQQARCSCCETPPSCPLCYLWHQVSCLVHDAVFSSFGTFQKNRKKDCELRLSKARAKAWAKAWARGHLCLQGLLDRWQQPLLRH